MSENNSQVLEVGCSCAIISSTFLKYILITYNSIGFFILTDGETSNIVSNLKLRFK